MRQNTGVLTAPSKDDAESRVMPPSSSSQSGTSSPSSVAAIVRGKVATYMMLTLARRAALAAKERTYHECPWACIIVGEPSSSLDPGSEEEEEERRGWR